VALPRVQIARHHLLPQFAMRVCPTTRIRRAHEIPFRRHQSGEHRSRHPFVALAQAMAEAGHDVSAVVYPDGLIAQRSCAIQCTLYHAKFRNVFDLRGYSPRFKAARIFARTGWSAISARNTGR
jgi:hypothetical protein